jgi:phosphoheptose isomerase
MADETGALMHRALRQGVRDGLGYGASLGYFIFNNPDLFPHREVSIMYHTFKLAIPTTIHVTIGADIIHQHPDTDFTTIGTASGRDFHQFVLSVSKLEGGVFLNFGSAVTGPEVFLKSLTIARNLGNTISHITTANFDLLPVPSIERPMGYDEPLYYYRPRKNIVLRPTSLGGQGYHITGDHRVTIPTLYHRIKPAMQDLPKQTSVASHPKSKPARQNKISAVIEDLVSRQPALTPVIHDLHEAFHELSRCFQTGGTLFVCGNGGSMSDALHISGELLKSYANHRSLPDSIRISLSEQPEGEGLIRNLEPGLRTVVLGVNPSLSTAVSNDMEDRDMGFAQELIALARSGDAFLGLSTSGNAQNVSFAAQTARALGLTVICFTGKSGGKLANLSDITVNMPVSRTDRVQEYHVLCYHALCEMLEIYFFHKGNTQGSITH